eukprot:gene15007-20188_t
MISVTTLATIVQLAITSKVFAFSNTWTYSISPKYFSSNNLYDDEEISTSLHHLFIGSLPFSFTDDSLSQLLKENGLKNFLNPRISLDRKTKKSRGFGYVDFPQKFDAVQALEVLNGTFIEGRHIKVDFDGGVDGPNRGRRLPPTSKDFSLFIGNLDFSLSESDLGSIIMNTINENIPFKVRISSFMDRSKGFGHIDFGSNDHMELALEKLDKMDILGRIVNVERAKGPSSNNNKFSDARDMISNPLQSSKKYSLFLGNLAYTVTSETIISLIEDLFGVGVVEKVRLATDFNTKKPKGFCHIDLIDDSITKLAAEKLNNMELLGRKLRVDVTERKINGASNLLRNKSRKLVQRHPSVYSSK